MYEIYLAYKFSFSYFSVIPIVFKNDDNLSTNKILGYMLFFLPLVGLTLGLISLGTFIIFEEIHWLAGIISASLYMLLYGFIHTEAIIDVIDSIYAKHSGRDAYEVIKEPTVGAMGILYSCVFIILKISTIVYIFLNNFFVEFLAIVILSRLVILYLVFFLEFKSSFVNQLKQALSINILIKASVLFLFIGYLLIGFDFIILFVIAIMIGFILTKFIKKQLSFINGDVLGCVLEVSELFLFLLVILWL